MIYVIRHGQTEMNNAHALQGRSDHPLDERGVAQAREVGRRLAERGIVFSRVFSSPLRRAAQTARLIAPDVPVLVDERLIEMDYGPYEGADLKVLSPELAYFFSDFVHHPAPAGMESLSEVVARTGAFVEQIKDLSGNSLISTHAITMKGILEYLTPESQGAYWSTYIGNCAVYVAAVVVGRIGVPVELALE